MFIVIDDLSTAMFKQRTDRAPKDRNVAETDPSKFATMLIERLDKVKDEQDKMKHLVEMMTTPEVGFHEASHSLCHITLPAADCSSSY